MAWIIRDDDADQGRTYVRSWRCLKNAHGVDTDIVARWTSERSKAFVFRDPDVARLVAMHAGGRCLRARAATSSTPFWRDACGHTRPRDRFLGTVIAAGCVYDVFVYQDNALDAVVLDMHVCVRFGPRRSAYLSLGNVPDYLRRLELREPGEGQCDGLVQACAALVREWLRAQLAPRPRHGHSQG